MIPSTPPQNIHWNYGCIPSWIPSTPYVRLYGPILGHNQRVPSSTLAAPAPLGPSSTQTICTSCGKTIFTSTSRKAKPAAWWSCMLLFIVGCFCGCCLIPCCMDSCNVVNHRCPKCGSYLGQYRP